MVSWDNGSYLLSILRDGFWNRCILYTYSLISDPFPSPPSSAFSTQMTLGSLNISQNHRVSKKKIFSYQLPTATSETVCLNHLKFAVQVGSSGLNFQVIRTKGPRVIAVGSWSENIYNSL